MQSPTEPWCFHNTATHTSYSFDLTTYLQDYTLFRAFNHAFVLKYNSNSTQGFALLNPFMRSLTQLPSKIDSKCAKDPSRLEDIIDASYRNMLVDVYVTRYSTILLRFLSSGYLAWTKPGNESWSYAKFDAICSNHVLFYDDRLLVVDHDQGFVQINFSNEIPQPQAEIVIPKCNMPVLDYACHLADCAGDIILVSFMCEDAYKGHLWKSVEMYRLDHKEKTCDEIENLSNHSIFLGEDRTFSVSCTNLHRIPANSIFLCMLYYGETACYDLRTCRVQLLSWKPRLHPSNLVKKLITCCQITYWSIIGGVDEE